MPFVGSTSKNLPKKAIAWHQGHQCAACPLTGTARKGAIHIPDLPISVCSINHITGAISARDLPKQMLGPKLVGHTNLVSSELEGGLAGHWTTPAVSVPVPPASLKSWRR